MARDGARTRTAIMDAAQDLILQQGFAATSIDQIIERTGITKGAFFYHFKSKSDLAHALVERYAAVDAAHLERTLDRAENLSRDPLQQVLIFVGLLEEEAGELTEPFAGCLYASYCYEAQLFTEDTIGIIQSGVAVTGASAFADKLQAVVDLHPPRLPATAEKLVRHDPRRVRGVFRSLQGAGRTPVHRRAAWPVPELSRTAVCASIAHRHGRTRPRRLRAPWRARPNRAVRRRAAARSPAGGGALVPTRIGSSERRPSLRAVGGTGL